MVLETGRYYTFSEQCATRVTHGNLKQEQTDGSVDCSMIVEEKAIQSSSVQALTGSNLSKKT